MRIADALLRMLVRERLGPRISFDDRMLILDRCLRVMRRGARRHESDAHWRAFEQARAALVELCTVERLLALAVYRDVASQARPWCSLARHGSISTRPGTSSSRAAWKRTSTGKNSPSCV